MSQIAAGQRTERDKRGGWLPLNYTRFTALAKHLMANALADADTRMTIDDISKQHKVARGTLQRVKAGTHHLWAEYEHVTGKIFNPASMIGYRQSAMQAFYKQQTVDAKHALEIGLISDDTYRLMLKAAKAEMNEARAICSHKRNEFVLSKINRYQNLNNNSLTDYGGSR